MATTNSTTTPDAGTCARVTVGLEQAASALRALHLLAGQAVDAPDDDAGKERASLAMVAVQELARSIHRRLDAAVVALGGGQLGNFADDPSA